MKSIRYGQLGVLTIMGSLLSQNISVFLCSKLVRTYEFWFIGHRFWIAQCNNLTNFNFITQTLVGPSQFSMNRVIIEINPSLTSKEARWKPLTHFPCIF